MISDVMVTRDGAGFPVVSWVEDRRLGHPETVECRIMKTVDGELYFVARGGVRLGTFEEGRPWQMLQSFAIKSAEELYQGQVEKELHRYFVTKRPMAGILLRDDSKVIVANFRIGMPVHLNCADASLGEVMKLHAVLSEAFIHGAHAGLSRGWRCAADDGRTPTYDPARTEWPDQVHPNRSSDRSFSWAVTLGLSTLLLGIVLVLVYLILLLFGPMRP